MTIAKQLTIDTWVFTDRIFVDVVDVSGNALTT
jgi:hypothetical protein